MQPSSDTVDYNSMAEGDINRSNYINFARAETQSTELCLVFIDRAITVFKRSTPPWPIFPVMFWEKDSLLGQHEWMSDIFTNVTDAGLLLMKITANSPCSPSNLLITIFAF